MSEQNKSRDAPNKKIIGVIAALAVIIWFYNRADTSEGTKRLITSTALLFFLFA
jgi:hypothetical protein